MKYAILIHEPKSVPTPEVQAEMLKEYGAYFADMKAAGAHIGGQRLQTENTAARVTLRGGKRSVVDGPFAETKEVLGGFFLIEAKTREEAIEWGAKCPGAKTGTIEVRPIHEM